MGFTTKANEAQVEAIQATDGPLLIIAGPGSGKTFTLVERIVYLILERGAEPESLLVVTFTDKAAAELRTRVSTRLNELGIRFNINEMYLGTFHSVCLRWLEEYREFTRLKRNFSMMDQFDQQYFLYQRLKEFDHIEGMEYICGRPQNSSSWYRSKELLRWVNYVSEEALDTAILLDAPEPEVQALGRCTEVYHRLLEEENALDFSTIQFEALRLLREQPAVLEELQQKIEYLMVDEYQDTNTIQEMILLLLAGDKPNLCVVGDDDQGLYRFRGATIRNILEFRERVGDGECRQVTLTTNYRSHPDIIDFYNGWIGDHDWQHGRKTFRYKKKIVPNGQTIYPHGPTVVKVSALEQDLYHQEVLAFLHALRDEGQLTDWNQVAFLFRSVKNRRATQLAQFLEDNGIAVYAPRANQFFEREEIRLMIGALIFLFPQFSEVRKWNADAHLDIWNYYDEECFRTFAEELRKPENEGLLRWARPLTIEHSRLGRNTDYAFSGLFYRLLQFPMFSRYLDAKLLHDRFQNSRPMRNLAILSQLLNKFEYLHHISVLTPEYLERNLRDLFNSFFRYLRDGGLGEYEDDAEYAPSGSVSMLTIHQSKGMEFPIVVVCSLYTRPSENGSDLETILQERYLSKLPFEPSERTKFYDFWRLYYTAFSRAQNLLVLAGHEQRSGSWQTPSKYFAKYFDSVLSWRDPTFRINDLPLEKIKEVNIKREYSFTSHITVFENCAEQYRFFKALEYAPVRTSPILFGTLVHQTIEDIHKTVLRGGGNGLSEDQVVAWFDTNYAWLTKRERVYLAPVIKRVALEHVLRYYRRYQGNWSHIRDAEVDVSLVKDDYILTGKVDLIAGRDGTVELIDFKSEKKIDVNDLRDRGKLERYKRQLDVYAHIVEQRTGFEVSKTHLYYTSEEAGNPYITFPADKLATGQTVSAFDQVVRRIEVKDFKISERPIKICRECDMRFYCDSKPGGTHTQDN